MKLVPSYRSENAKISSVSRISNMTIGTMISKIVMTFAGALTAKRGKCTISYRELIIPSIWLMDPARKKLIKKLPTTLPFTLDSARTEVDSNALLNMLSRIYFLHFCLRVKNAESIYLKFFLEVKY
jgi:hypothetical protein